MDTKMKRTPMPNMSDAAAQRAMLNSNVSPRAELWAINIIAERDRLAAENKALREALERIERWCDFPISGATWEDGRDMSYGAAFGSNGERDYMRGIARAALAKAKGAA